MAPKRNEFPIVLRFKGLHPRQLSRFAMHGLRCGGDLAHVDQKLTGRNEVLVGDKDWHRTFCDQLIQFKQSNLTEEIAARLKRQRRKEAEAVRQRGPVEPWASSREGPMREGILTANAHWFGGAGAAQWNAARAEAFVRRARSFLEVHFGHACIHARVDWDEEALHVHFVLAAWTKKTSANRGTQVILQPSSHPLLSDYEAAQSAAGAFFADIGLTRGTPHAAARKEARAAGLPVPEKIRHTPPTEWRSRVIHSLRHAGDALKHKWDELAAQQADLERARQDLLAKKENLKKIRQQQIQLQQQMARQLREMQSDVAIITKLCEENSIRMPPVFLRLNETYHSPRHKPSA